MIAPTGSGKSLIVRTVLGLAPGFEHVVIAVPMVHVQSSFMDESAIAWGDRMLETCFVALHGGGSVSELEESFVDLWSPVTTHAALARVTPPPDCTGRLLVLDEGHHAASESGNQISKFRDHWLASGGAVLLVTATPFRNDRADVLDESWRRVERTITDHISPDDGGPYGPPNLVSRTFVLDGLCPQDKAALTDGLSADIKSQKPFADQVVAQWVADGRPKAIVIVPACDSEGWTVDMLEALYVAGVSAGRVLDATGSAVADKRRTQTRLDAERDVVNYAASCTDVMIGCRRFDEASDWPVCSHVYVVGYPRSVPLTLQRWGRSFRSKTGIAGHPCPDVASISFFVPQWSDALHDDAGTTTVRRYRDDAMLLAACLNDYTTALPYAIDGARARRVVAEHHDIGIPDFNPAERAEAIACIATLREKYQSIPALVDALASLPKPQACAALSILAERIPGNYQRWLVRDALDRAMKAASSDSRRGSVSDRSLVAEHMTAEFQAALAGVDAFDFESFDSTIATCATFTGQTIDDLTRSLAGYEDKTIDEFDAAVHAYVSEHGRRPATATSPEWDRWYRWCRRNGFDFNARIDSLGYGQSRERIEAELDAYLAEHGRPPTQLTSPEWNRANDFLQRHCETSVARLAKAKGYKVKTPDRGKSIAKLTAELAEFKLEHGHYPKTTDDQKWTNWAIWLRKQGRNWNEFVGGVVRLTPDKERTEERLIADLASFKSEHGRYPTKSDDQEWYRWMQWCHRTGAKWSDYVGKKEPRTRERLESDLARFKAENGRPPTAKENDEWKRWVAWCRTNGFRWSDFTGRGPGRQCA
jgi:hypothetical protein